MRHPLPIRKMPTSASVSAPTKHAPAHKPRGMNGSTPPPDPAKQFALAAYLRGEAPRASDENMQ